MTVEIKTSEIARQLREALVDQGNLLAASQAAEMIANEAIESLNELPINVATHILAVPLIAHGLLQTTAEWWATDFAHAPLPETYAALVDLTINLPVQLIGETYDTRSEPRPDPEERKD